VVCSIEGCNFFYGGKISCIGFSKRFMDSLNLLRLYRDKMLHHLSHGIELLLQSPRDADR
jgi:hypothetical protein